jgi:hypothetical protein
MKPLLTRFPKPCLYNLFVLNNLNLATTVLKKGLSFIPLGKYYTVLIILSSLRRIPIHFLPLSLNMTGMMKFDLYVSKISPKI